MSNALPMITRYAAAVELIRWQDLVSALTRTNRLTDTHLRAYQESLADFDRLRGMN